MRATRVANTRATQYITRAPGTETYCVSLMEQGTSRLMLPGSHEPVVGNGETGLIFSGDPGTRFAASDNSVRSSLWVPVKHLCERLELLLDREYAEAHTRVLRARHMTLNHLYEVDGDRACDDGRIDRDTLRLQIMGQSAYHDDLVKVGSE
jgi:hypothetical protein